MRIARLYWRVFFWTGMPFGVLTGAYNALMISPSKGVVIGVWAGALFGACMSFILVTTHWACVARYKEDAGYDITGTVQERVLALGMAFDEAFDRCLAALDEMGSCDIRKENKATGEIEAVTPTTLKSFGEMLVLRLSPSGQTSTNLVLSSRPTTKTTLVDFGKGIENIERLCKRIQTPEGINR